MTEPNDMTNSSAETSSVARSAEPDKMSPENGADNHALAKSSARQAERELYISKIVGARESLSQAEKRHADDISTAETALKKAQGDYETNVKKAKAVLEQIERDYAKQISSFSGMTLYKDRLEYNGTVIPLTSNLTVHAEASGSIEASPDIIDTRKLTLTVTAPTGVTTLECDPDKGELTRSFVRDVMQLVPGSDVRAEERAQKMSMAQERINQAEQNTVPVMNAQQWLEQVKAKDDEIRLAKRALADLDRNATADQRSALVDYDKGRKRKKIIIWLVIIGVLIIAAIVAYLVLFNG